MQKIKGMRELPGVTGWNIINDYFTRYIILFKNDLNSKMRTGPKNGVRS